MQVVPDKNPIDCHPIFSPTGAVGLYHMSKAEDPPFKSTRCAKIPVRTTNHLPRRAAFDHPDLTRERFPARPVDESLHRPPAIWEEGALLHSLNVFTPRSGDAVSLTHRVALPGAMSSTAQGAATARGGQRAVPVGREGG